MNPGRIIEAQPVASQDSGHLFLHVLYDSPVMQTAAAMVCDQMQAAFEVDLEVHVLWSHFQHLADEHYAREAAEVAAQSDVVIVATECQNALPGAVARWLGAWMCQHHKPDTAFCGLFLDRMDQQDRLPPVAAMLGAAAELTGREWLTGAVRRQPSPAVGKTVVMKTVASTRALFYAPVCHGING